MDTTRDRLPLSIGGTYTGPRLVFCSVEQARQDMAPAEFRRALLLIEARAEETRDGVLFEAARSIRGGMFALRYPLEGDVHV